MINEIDVSKWHDIGYPSNLCSIPLTVEAAEEKLGLIFIEGRNNGVGTPYYVLVEIDGVPVNLVGYFDKTDNIGIIVEIKCTETRVEALIYSLCKYFEIDSSELTIYLDSLEPKWSILEKSNSSEPDYIVHSEDQAKYIVAKLTDQKIQRSFLIKKL